METVHDYLNAIEARFEESGLFFGHGTDNSWDEAVALILHVLKLPPTTGVEVLGRPLTSDEAREISRLVDERVHKRLPLAYLIHEAWFAGMPFYVDERVLVPRSPIAELIEAQFSPWIQPDKVHEILDLCTGSGCIAIACSKYFPNAHVDASDISMDALNVANENVKKHLIESKVSLFKSDLFQSIPQKKYDIIVTNPPYVSAHEMSVLPKEYTHEPDLGLAAGADGLDLAVRILDHAGDFLAPDGILVVEVGNSETALADAYPDVPFMWLEFERGGGGVFLLTAEQVKQFKRS